MLDAFLSLLRPLESLISWPLVAAHHLAAAAGLPPGPAWVLALVALVVTVRAALLPLVLRQHQVSRAAARGDRPRTLGCLPALATGVILFALYRLLADTAAGVPVGAMSADLVRSATTADVLGVTLPATLGALGVSGPGVVVGLTALVAAAVSYATARWLTVRNLPEPVVADGPHAQLQADLHRRMSALMPVMAGLGLLVAAPVVPAGVVLYWAASSLWTLGQQAAINRWSPTPGSAAWVARQA